VSGSSRFSWEIPPRLRREPGWYAYKVTLEDAWDEVQRNRMRCTLLQGTLEVFAVADTTWVLVGSIAATCGLLLALAGAAGVAYWLRCRDEEARLAAWRKGKYNALRRLWDERTGSFAVGRVTSETGANSRLADEIRAAQNLMRQATLVADAVDMHGYILLHYAVSAHAPWR
jgi:hypothetical protein